MKRNKEEIRYLLFDGYCNLCNGFVQFVLKHEKKPFTKFSSLQSDAGRKLLELYKIDPDQIDSIVFIANDQLRIKSRAVLEIFRYLKLPWNTFVVFKIFPRALSDLIYDWIAKRRYKMFGKREHCWVPTPELMQRFTEKEEQL